MGIETSGRAGSIALAQSNQLIAERDLSASGRRHARTLVPEIGALLREHHLSPEQIDVTAVSLGPGSFTGLRVGVVCAKVFAFATECQLVGIDTFLAVAAQTHEDVSDLWVIEDALRGDLFAGHYGRSSAGEWEVRKAPHLVSGEAWRDALSADCRISGPGLERWAGELPDSRLLPPAVWHPRAGTIATLGGVRAEQGELDDLWRIEPNYIRRSAAEEKRDAEPA